MSGMITFKASFAPLESAIKISSEGGMRITLDIPESDLANALYLLELRDKVFTVNVTHELTQKGIKTPKKSLWQESE